MTIKIRIAEGQDVPLFYGHAYYEPGMFGQVVMLMPLNFIYRFLRWMQRKSFKQPTDAQIEEVGRRWGIIGDIETRAFNQGKREGLVAGKETAIDVFVRLANANGWLVDPSTIQNATEDKPNVKEEKRQRKTVQN